MNVPRVILEVQSYRKDVVGDVEEVIYQDGEEVEIFQTDLELAQSYESVKERTNYALLQLYEQKGYDLFKKTCLNMKGNSWFNTSDYSTFKGECAEVFLYVTILEFIEKFNLPWYAFLSLVIPHRDGIEGHTTEIDLVLVSEEMITVFESKSYGGDKTIKDVCSIVRKNGTKDIYGQNALHCESLLKQIADFNINDQRGMKSVLFSFAEGSLDDVRDPQYKKFMPVLTEDNVLQYLTSLTKLKNKYWKSGVVDKVSQLSKMLTAEDHMAYINRNKK
ncbi:nuclease-related domain-containing protein [Lysinibacillus xylanilyticus]|uniref:nuclease-related domain-containing protein n=1 Tax=Lysinibacillus xylanilyticus TaxID=582475 RepID=UPI0036DC3DD0